MTVNIGNAKRPDVIMGRQVQPVLPSLSVK